MGLIFVIATGCGQDHSPEYYSALSERISREYYKTEVLKDGDTLKINVYLPLSDIASPTKTQLIRQLIFNEIMMDDSMPLFDVMRFKVVAEEDNRIIEPYELSVDMARFIASQTPYDTTWNRWAKYIINNISGDQILDYNSMIRLAVLDERVESVMDSSSMDLIYCLSMYMQECRGQKFQVNYSNLLVRTDSMCVAASRDGILWNNNYDPRILSYFFEECKSAREW